MAFYFLRDSTLCWFPALHNLSRYRDKHIDTSARTGVPIDAYADKHYKIWYIKAPSMCLEDWYKITFASLDEPFRPLFDEIYI